MSTISGVSSGTSAGWSDISAARAARKESLFTKLDADKSGAVDATELQGLLDKVADKTDTTALKADDVLKKLDTDGNGTLDKRELKAGLKDLLPAPSSTQAFAEQRGPSFEQLDTDGDGNISKAEFEAGKKASSSEPVSSSDSSATDKTAGAAPPDGPPPGGGGGGGASSASDTTFDPLDANKDGVVSDQERAAGGLKDLLADLMKAIDSNGDKKVSASEVDTFQQNVTAALHTLASATGANASTADGTTTDASTRASMRGHEGFSLSSFAQLVLKQYASNASAAAATGTSLSVSA